jgi:hypothetical protein
VHPNGEIRWQKRTLYLSKVLAKDHVGLKQIDESIWEIRYSFHLLGLFDERTGELMPANGWHGNDY